MLTQSVVPKPSEVVRPVGAQTLPRTPAFDLEALVKATPQGHEVVSSFQMPAGGEGPTWAHPVVCGGRLYLRHGNMLHVYDVRAD